MRSLYFKRLEHPIIDGLPAESDRLQRDEILRLLARAAQHVHESVDGLTAPRQPCLVPLDVGPAMDDQSLEVVAEDRLLVLAAVFHFKRADNGVVEVVRPPTKDGRPVVQTRVSVKVEEHVPQMRIAVEDALRFRILKEVLVDERPLDDVSVEQFRREELVVLKMRALVPPPFLKRAEDTDLLLRHSLDVVGGRRGYPIEPCDLCGVDRQRV